MRKLFFTILLFSSLCSFALTIPKGTLYFDNSKTQYSAVRFVYGSDQNARTYVLAMTQDGNKWRVEIPQTVYNMYRYTFVGGNVTTGQYAQTFSAYKDSISLQLGINRTATSEVQMNAGDIFVPESGDNWAQGYWTSLSAWQADQTTPSASISGTLPVVYISTNGTITDTENYKSGSLYIDPLNTGYQALGTKSSPISAQFKGRGNWTWRGFDKKPYKIKFDVKQKVLGMPNNRHWCLLAGADDDLGFLRNPTGFMVSEALQMRWTPRMVPVELVMNGKYMGLYFLTEHVRIAANRVKITEQAEGEAHPDSVTGGWLVEIDNYPSDNNIMFYEGNGQEIMISLKEPEVLSAQQRNYIENQMYALNDALYATTSTPLEKMLDLEEAAKFYLVQEILDDCESYHGSCFLYKDRDRNGKIDKWKFGPVWDFGNSYRHSPRSNWIYVDPEFSQIWVEQLASWPAFQEKVKEQWWIFYNTCKDNVRNRISTFASTITPAAKNDAEVWRYTQNYCDNSNMSGKRNDFLWHFDWRIDWLYSQWGEGTKPAAWDYPMIEDGVQEHKILRNGHLLIERNGIWYDVLGRPIILQ